MDGQQLKNWLLENGGPAIRYRTAAELLDDVDTTIYKKDLIASPMTQLWLSRMGQPGGLTSFHGSHPEAFENACTKLSEMGIVAGTPVFDRKTAPVRRDFAERESYTGKFIVAGALTRAGYGSEPAVQAFLCKRLEDLYGFANAFNYDVYIDQDTYGDFPAAFRKRSFLIPAYNGLLPSIYDMLAFAYWPPALKTNELQQKIDTVVNYVLHPDYQELEDGYGVMRDAPRRYWSIGWSVHLPGYKGFDVMPDGRAKYFIQRLEMMARFPTVHEHRWFKECLGHLEGFQQEDGTYRFPGRYLREQQSGYWVTGAYTRLDEDRRRRISLTVESTFRMLSIKRYNIMKDQIRDESI
jgi:hypothetical protein